MAEEIKLVLCEFKLSHLWPLFEEQKIDDLETFQSIEDDQIPYFAKNVMGDAIRLRKAIAKLKLASLSDEPPCKKRKDVESELVSNECVVEKVGAESQNLGGEIPIIFISNLPNNEIIENNETIGNYATIENNETIGTVSELPSTITVDSDIYPQSSGSSQINESEFNLLSLLNKDLIGAAIVQKAQRKSLNNQDRDKICEIITTHYLNTQKRMTHEILLMLSKKIEEGLPSEKRTTYYVEPIKKKDSKKQKSERARGKLVEKYRNKLHLLKCLEKGETIRHEFNDENVSQDIPQEARDSQIWLKNNGEPQEDLMYHWKISYVLRKITNYKTIDEFIKEWPALKSPIAPELVSYDFAQMHQVVGIDPHQEFENLFSRILNLKEDSLSPADSTIQNLLHSELTTDSKLAIQLYLLPSLIPPKGRRRLPGKNSNWKPSTQESRDSIYIHVKNAGDIGKSKQARIDSMFSKGLTVQPYIIILGPALNNVTGVLVVVNNQDYKCDSVIEAIKFCFKLYQVLDAKYPYECEHLWYLIQWCVFKYRTDSDPVIPFIEPFIKNIL